ncbi:hypothetical protein [Micromonospora coerulea]|uniref:hypothetical protein n=1 Tax=Micromonospora coerulea TaxID=47856 RepID=UPI001904DE79|nr:hypothetical protein [Micromonospora veneta]
MQAEVHELTEDRRRIARLAVGERLVLPDEVVAIQDRMRALGCPASTVSAPALLCGLAR